MRWIEFQIGKEKKYLNPKKGNILSEQEYQKHLQKDFDAGFRDRCVGIYDKWYRYNRLDGGAAYDKGQKAAVDEYSEKLPDKFTVIELMLPAVCNQ